MQGNTVPGINERAILFLIASVQFVNIIDFMMVMPMGPYFAAALAIPTSKLGLVGGSYTAAAAVSGVVCSTFLDRFDRRSALATTMLGLVIATAAGGLAVDLPTLLAARIAAGAFGGPAAALTFSIVGDVIAPERRGRAMGVVMSSFAVASVFGVPLGLKAARMAGWRAPFFGVAALGLVVAGCALFMMPKMRGHLDTKAGDLASMGDTLSRPVVWLALMTSFVMSSTMFALVPNLAAFLVYNTHYPADDLDRLYLAGGLCSFASMNVVGRLVDAFGAPATAALGTVIYSSLVYVGFVMPANSIPTMVFFAGWMVSSSLRNVPWNALATRVPRANERARFMSLNSAVQHIACAAGAFAAASYLTERPDKSLAGIDVVAQAVILVSMAYPVLIWVIDAQVRPKATV